MQPENEKKGQICTSIYSSQKLWNNLKLVQSERRKENHVCVAQFKCFFKEHLKILTVLLFLTFEGREFHINGPTKANLALHISMRVDGSRYLFEPYRSGALYNNALRYGGASPWSVLYINIELLK